MALVISKKEVVLLGFREEIGHLTIRLESKVKILNIEGFPGGCIN